ncbi:DUF5818 domain-containing protein [uncultured Parasphingorhabdus sp.]|uniref:DUF5818 domain-containing protein n=1 Tax=uncultured Parasphingorhabdus sp. TaxID=2709694 RepID=UPI0030D88B59|tara:strand:- start:248 stop:457 length:210 start_codon:yes stop_codon:yes gene_type:complete
MNHSNSNRLRLTGKLIKGERHYLLQCADENVWRLNFLDVKTPKDGTQVIIEGVQSGVDGIDVDWVGAKK